MTDALSAVASWFSQRHSDDRDLTPEQLRALAEDLAGQPDLWRNQVRHDEDERVFVRLHRDHHLDAVAGRRGPDLAGGAGPGNRHHL